MATHPKKREDHKEEAGREEACQEEVVEEEVAVQPLREESDGSAICRGRFAFEGPETSRCR